MKMVSILIDIDTDKKTTLDTGTHILGRGKLFKINDARISRNHGQLEVTHDSLVVTALHENPCFYKKGGKMEAQVLRKNNSVSLNTGDRLGLLPNAYWFEVLHGTLAEVLENESVKNETQEKEVDTLIDSDKETDDEAESRLNPVINEDVNSENNNVDQELTQNCNYPRTQVFPEIENKEGNSSKEELIKENSVNDNISTSKPNNSDDKSNSNEAANEPGSPSIISDQQKDQDTNEPPQPTDQISSPLKRPHDDDEPGQSDDAKKTKSDTEEKPDVKVDFNPDQAGSSGSNDNVKPDQPQGRLRERCMYGANCYRRNPLHLSQFSHPQDADWGSGPRAPCPWGAACAKRDARHWRDHEHPAGRDQPPSPPPPPPPQQQRDARVLYRKGNIYYINAHTVKVYDDRVVAEDSDGNPVDSDGNGSDENSADSDYDF